MLRESDHPPSPSEDGRAERTKTPLAKIIIAQTADIEKLISELNRISFPAYAEFVIVIWFLCAEKQKIPIIREFSCKKGHLIKLNHINLYNSFVQSFRFCHICQSTPPPSRATDRHKNYISNTPEVAIIGLNITFYLFFKFLLYPFIRKSGKILSLWSGSYKKILAEARRGGGWQPGKLFR